MTSDPQPSIADHHDAADQHDDAIVLRVLLYDAPPGQLWHIDEIQRKIGDFARHHTQDALNRLQNDGLVHRINDYAFASRAAIASEHLANVH